jgi:hypothetical protein
VKQKNSEPSKKNTSTSAAPSIKTQVKSLCESPFISFYLCETKNPTQTIAVKQKNSEPSKKNTSTSAAPSIKTQVKTSL